MTNVADIRSAFVDLRAEYPTGNAPNGTLEIVGASFLVDDPAIFGAPSPKWLAREVAWYMSMSLNVNDIEAPIPPAWIGSASPRGDVLSNYGWCMLSPANGRQLAEVVAELRSDPGSRRATAVYARPSMYSDARAMGCRDVMCTLGVSYLIRDGRLDAVVHMRSSDAVRGLRGDIHWQELMQTRIAAELAVAPGRMIWQASSLHCYPGDWHLIDHFAVTGDWAGKVRSWGSGGSHP